MRLLCLAFLGGDYPQLMRKLDAQVRAFRALGVEAEGVVIGPDKIPNGLEHVFRYVRLPWISQSYVAAADALVQELAPDAVYFRYPLADAYLAAFVRRHRNVVFEHNTIETLELTGDRLANETAWGTEVLRHAAGFASVTGEILEYELQRSGRDIPGVVIGNGIDAEAAGPLVFSPPNDAIHILCAASFERWHGIDRLLLGMAAYAGPQRFVLHLAGRGEAQAQYKRMTQDLGLADHVCFYDWLGRDALAALTAKCHVGVGPLALHRKGLMEAVSLKLREYCLFGLPFFFSGKDPDFPAELPFARAIPNDETPVDMAVVSELAAQLSQAGLRQTMHAYCRDRLNWQTKCSSVLPLLHGCAGASPPPRSLAVVVAYPPGTASHALEATRRSLQAQRYPKEGVYGGKAQVEFVVAGSSLPPLDDALTIPATGGRNDLWNAGVRASQSQWILPVDAGDTLQGDVLDAMCLALHSQPHLNALALRAVDQNGVESHAPCPPLPREYALPGRWLFRKSLWEDVGGFEPAHPATAEAVLWLRCLPSLHVRRLPGVRLARRLQPEGFIESESLILTQVPDLFPLEAILNAHHRLAASSEAMLPALQGLPDSGAKALWQGLAHEGKGNLSEAVVSYLTVIQTDPLGWQAPLRLALIFRAKGHAAKAAFYRKVAIERNAQLAEIFIASPQMLQAGLDED